MSANTASIKQTKQLV